MSDSAIFIVDDDVSAAASLQALIETFGYSTELFHSAESFLEKYDGQSKGFLILDIRMRGMSGLDLLRHLESIGSPLNVAIISGHADESDRRQAIGHGALTVLDKPFPAEELHDLIRKTM